MAAIARRSLILRTIYEWTLQKAAAPAAEGWLATIAFIESSIFLVPADVLFVPMALAKPPRAYRYALTATIASTLSPGRARRRSGRACVGALLCGPLRILRSAAIANRNNSGAREVTLRSNRKPSGPSQVTIKPLNLTNARALEVTGSNGLAVLWSRPIRGR